MIAARCFALMPQMLVLLTVLVMGLFGAPVLAETTLWGRTVSFGVLAYDDPKHPLFVGLRHKAVVGDGSEFDLRPEGAQNNIDVIPVEIDITAERVEVRFYPAQPGWTYDSAFNGYVLSFDTECTLFHGAEIDRAFSNMELAEDAIFFERGRLYINARDLFHDRDSRFAINLVVGDCPVS